jgi:hypothetical protein
VRPNKQLRTLALVIGMALVAAACGGGSDSASGGKDDDGQYGSELLDEQVTTTLARPDKPAAPGDPGTTIVKKRSSSSGSSGGSGSAAAGDTDDPIYTVSRRANGDFAPALLQPAPKGAKKIGYQLMVQAGKGPNAATVDHVVSMLRRVSGKTVEVTTVDLPGGPTKWKTSELHAYADQYSKTKSSREAAVLNVLFVKGEHQESSSILGVASRADVLTMFPDRYRNLGAGLNPQAIEAAVIMHETGHILSLVGHKVRPERQDKAHPGHSPNKESVMYWAVETDDIVSAFVGAPPKEFDRDDLQDLETIRNM